MSKKIVAIVGSYRKGGAIDSAVEAILAGARERGAETRTFYLIEEHIEFCTHCRQCTQQPGPERGRCVLEDGLEAMLTEIEAADAVVLASPVSYYNATAIFRRFLERLLGSVYWPWGQNSPHLRSQRRPRQAILVASAAMPGLLIPFATGTARALRVAAKSLGARPMGSLWIGLIAQKPQPQLSARTLNRARRMGMELA
jgi:putative NADPH-quinone reductase